MGEPSWTLLRDAKKNLDTMRFTRNRILGWGKSTEELDVAIRRTEAAIAEAEAAQRDMEAGR